MGHAGLKTRLPVGHRRMVLSRLKERWRIMLVNWLLSGLVDAGYSDRATAWNGGKSVVIGKIRKGRWSNRKGRPSTKS